MVFTYNGSFKNALESLKRQAYRAMYASLGKCGMLDLPLDLQLELFDATVLPIMLYACEAWGAESYKIMETLHLTFLKTYSVC